MEIHKREEYKMPQYNKSNDNLKNYFLIQTINTLNCTFNHNNLLNEDNVPSGSFGDWLSTYISYIPGWNWIKKRLVGQNVKGEVIKTWGEGKTVDNLVATKNTVRRALNNASSNNELAEAATKSNEANQLAGEASGGLASLLPESIRKLMREHSDITTGIAIGAGVLGLIYLYKKFIKNPDKPPDKQTIQYAQKLNNLQINNLSPEQLNAKVL